MSNAWPPAGDQPPLLTWWRGAAPRRELVVTLLDLGQGQVDSALLGRAAADEAPAGLKIAEALPAAALDLRGSWPAWAAVERSAATDDLAARAEHERLATLDPRRLKRLVETALAGGRGPLYRILH